MRPSRAAVVVTCYNLGRTLSAALESVRAQTLAPSEFLVVDDGSDDLFTRQLLARQAALGCRVVTTANRGASAARNTGIARTSSDYVVVLDGDDRLAPEYLATLARHLDDRPETDFVSCGMRSFGEADGCWVPPEPSIVNGIAFGALHVSSMFRRRVWEEVGGFDEELEAYEDLDFWTTALELGFRGEVLPACLLFYRVRPGSRIHRAWQRDTHVGIMGRFYEKHRVSMTRCAEALLIGKEEFILQQRTHQEHLEGERRRLEQALHDSHASLHLALQDLASLGGSRVEMADLRRLEPLSHVWGTDRGRPIDRYYIEGFLEAHGADVQGRVLEVKDAGYTRLFGGSRVARSDVLDIDPLNDQATIVADLSRADAIPDDTYDAFILTQTLGLVYDVRSALAHAVRILKPGGVLLCTVPAAGRLSFEAAGLDGDYWRFTEASVRALFAEVFPIDAFEVTGFGNVLATSAFLYGLADHELQPGELERVDPYFPLVYAIRAVKPTAAAAGLPAARAVRARGGDEGGSALLLLYHRIRQDAAEADPLSVSLDAFERQMEVIRERAEVIALPDLAEAVARRELKGQAVAVTFDDGYAETAALAAATLTRLGMPATVFVTSQGLDAPCEFWWSRVDLALNGARHVPGELDLQVAGLSFRLPTVTQVDRREACSVVREALYRATPAACEAVVAALEAWASGGPPARDSWRPLDLPGLRRLAAMPGITIGGHSARHACLPLLPDESRRTEIAGNRARLEEATGRPVGVFAYPYGEWDSATVRAVRDAGYTVAVTVDPRLARHGTPRLLLPRCEPPDTSSRSGFAEWLESRFSGR